MAAIMKVVISIGAVSWSNSGRRSTCGEEMNARHTEDAVVG